MTQKTCLYLWRESSEKCEVVIADSENLSIPAEGII